MTGKIELNSRSLLLAKSLCNNMKRTKSSSSIVESLNLHYLSRGGPFVVENGGQTHVAQGHCCSSIGIDSPTST